MIIERPDLLDLDRFKRQGFGDEQIAKAFCENGVGEDIEFNVTPYSIVRREGGFFDPVTDNEIVLCDEMEFGKEERQGLVNMFLLADEGADTIFWISPSGGSYVDARLVVARVIDVREDNEVGLECRGIVCKHSPEELYQIAVQLVGIEQGNIRKWIENAEELRSQPIGFKLGDNNWIDFALRVFGMGREWEAIRTGADVRQKEKIKSVVTVVRKRVEAQGWTGIALTQQFEWEMAREGYRLSAGNHGGSSLRGAQTLSTFDRVFRSSEIRVSPSGEVKHKCSQCGCWYTGDHCPYCI